MPRFEHRNQSSECGKYQNWRFDNHSPSNVSPISVLRMILFAGFRPNPVSLERFLQTFGISKKRREKQRANIEKNDHDRELQMDLMQDVAALGVEVTARKPENEDHSDWADVNLRQMRDAGLI